MAGVRNVPRTDGLLLHPLGRLVVQQGLVPLNTTREIDRVGAFVPRDARRFALTEPRIGGATPSVAPVSDEFPDSQFFEMSDAERLAAPGVVIREAGVSFGNDRYASDAAAGVPAPFRYTEIVVGAGRRARRAARPGERGPPGAPAGRSAVGRGRAGGDPHRRRRALRRGGPAGRPAPGRAGEDAMTEPSLVFLPWVAPGRSARPSAGRPRRPPGEPGLGDRRGEGQRRRTGYRAVRLLGPGDVTGLPPQQVIRTDPAPGARTFEANYLPLVEFDEPALPWLFTPASASAGRLRPWLCLVVVREQPGVQLAPPARGSLPVLRIGVPARPEEELPDLDDSWAWAHAQLATEVAMTDAALADALAADPGRSLSRLVCGRLLAEQTEYLACVVPTFEAGRLAGLGDDPGAAEGPAWRRAPGMAPVELPVLHHWRFATGPAGDFQSLALAIRGRPVADGFGTRAVDLSTSGLGIAGAEDAQVRLAGALLALDAPVAAVVGPGDRQGASRRPCVDVLNAPDQVPANNPLLAPPRYGSAYRTPPAALDPRVRRTLVRAAQHRPGEPGGRRAGHARGPAAAGDARGGGVGPGGGPARRGPGLRAGRARAAVAGQPAPAARGAAAARVGPVRARSRCAPGCCGRPRPGTRPASPSSGPRPGCRTWR